MEEKQRKPDIVLTGIPPSKKNSRNCFVKHGKLFNIPSEKYYSWHQAMSYELKQFNTNFIKFNFIHIIFYSDTERKWDLSNKAESCLDLLVDNGVIDDDNWKCVPKLGLEFGGIDKIHPRTEIYFYDI